MQPEEAIKNDYAVKADNYYEQARAEMLEYLPASSRRVLDVGCGNGAFGSLVKQSRAIEVWGIEPFESASMQAAAKLDKVVHGMFHFEAGFPAAHFDCIFFNDVLEHLLDPSAALRYARKLLTPKGAIVASIPNIRHFPTIWHLVMHGEWEYRDCGTLDKTHLRFFTRSSIVKLFRDEGFAIERIDGIHPYRGVPNASRRVWRLFGLTNALCLKRFQDMKYERFAVIAKPTSDV